MSSFLAEEPDFKFVSDHWLTVVVISSFPERSFVPHFPSPGTERLLLCDSGNSRVVELTCKGAHVRSLPVTHPRAVAVCGDVVAVGRGGGSGPAVVLLAYGSGQELCGVGRLGGGRGSLEEIDRSPFDGGLSLGVAAEVSMRVCVCM